jgi:TP901 family phage tail tape measure protein
VTNNFEHMRKGWTKAQKSFARAAEMRQAAEGVATFARTTRGLLVKPIQSFESFEEAIAELGAVSKLTGEPLARLESEALRLGTSIGEFDPTGAAKGMIELARAGYTEIEIMEALPVLLDLSTASHTELSEATKILTGVMGGYNFSATEAGKAADILTTTSTGSKTTLESLGQTFEYVGPVARAAGLDMEQTALIAGALGNSSIEASRAGTALNAILLRLAGARRGPGSEMMRDMGVALDEMVDGVKKTRDPLLVIAEIGEKIAGKTQREQLGIMGRIFGAEAAPAAAQLATALADVRTEQLRESLDTATGSTREMAEAMRQTGANETMQLTSSIETLNITLGKNMRDELSATKEALKSMIESITEWTNENPKLTKTILVTIGVIAILATILAGLLFTLVGVTTALGVMAVAMGSTKTGTQVLGGALRFLVVKIKAVAVSIWTTVLPAIWTWISTMAIAMFSAIKSFAITLWTVALPAMGAWIASLWASVPAALAAALPFLAVAAAIGAITLAIVQLIKHWEELDFAEGMKGIAESISEVGFLETAGELFDPRTVLRDIGVMGPAAPVPAGATAAGGAPGVQGQARMVVELAEGLRPGRTEATGGLTVETETGVLMPEGIP